MVIRMSETVEVINYYVCDFTDTNIKYVYDYVCDELTNFNLSFEDFKKTYFSDEQQILGLLNNFDRDEVEDLICQGITEVLYEQDIDDCDVQDVYSQEFDVL